VSTYELRDFPAGPGVAPTAWFVLVGSEVLGTTERGLWAGPAAQGDHGAAGRLALRPPSP
jgi:hypothetical protein